MNWEAIGAIGEILGAAGVIATLAYLAVQMRQSNRLAKRAAVQSLLAGRVEMNRFLASDPALTDLVSKGAESPDELDEGEWRRFTGVFSTVIRHYEAIFFDIQAPPVRISMGLGFTSRISSRIRRHWSVDSSSSAACQEPAEI